MENVDGALVDGGGGDHKWDAVIPEARRRGGGASREAAAGKRYYDGISARSAWHALPGESYPKNWLSARRRGLRASFTMGTSCKAMDDAAVAARGSSEAESLDRPRGGRRDGNRRCACCGEYGQNCTKSMAVCAINGCATRSEDGLKSALSSRLDRSCQSEYDLDASREMSASRSEATNETESPALGAPVAQGWVSRTTDQRRCECKRAVLGDQKAQRTVGANEPPPRLQTCHRSEKRIGESGNDERRDGGVRKRNDGGGDMRTRTRRTTTGWLKSWFKRGYNIAILLAVCIRETREVSIGTCERCSTVEESCCIGDDPPSSECERIGEAKHPGPQYSNGMSITTANGTS